MPAPKRLPRTAEFLLAADAAVEAGEKNDCAVKAVHIATGAPYADVLAFMTAQGRKKRGPTQMAVTHAAVRHFGFKTQRRACQLFLDKLPKGVIAENITTHHPERFPAAWADGKTYLLTTRNHILCIKNGINHDWSKGKSLRVIFVEEVVPVHTSAGCTAVQSTGVNSK